MKSFTERNPLVIGLVAIVVIAAGTTGSLVLNTSFFARLAHNYDITAIFPDGAGLRAGDRLTVAGVAVGTVGSIRQDGSSVRVVLKVNHGVELPSDTSAAIRVETVLGRRAVRLVTGKDWRHLLAKGAQIPLTRTSSPTEVLDVQTDAQGALAQLDAQSLNTFLADLGKLTSGKRDQVGTIIDGLNRLTSTVDQRRSQLSGLIDAANTVSSTLASRDSQLLRIIDNLEVVLRGLAVRRAAIGQLLDRAQAAAGQISSLIATNRPKIDAILAELHTDLGFIDTHQVDLAQTVAYLSAALEGFQSIGYSGANNNPNRWANVFLVGEGPVSADSVFGCGGAVDLALTAALGPDTLPCSQSAGPVKGAVAAGVVSPASPARAVGGVLLPVPSSAATTASLNALLIPLLAG